MKRNEIIQYLIDKYNYKTYLEIGVGGGKNFNIIKCEAKDGVDPNGNGNFIMKSDLFFKMTKSNKKWDIIFIDGLHIMDQVDRDIENSLDHLGEGGTIVMHDCNPKTHKHQQVPRIQKAWNGTVWKSFVKLRCIRSDLFMCVVDTDHGCGIIRFGRQKTYTESLKRCLKYNYFKINKKELLNLISIGEFKRLK